MAGNLKVDFTDEAPSRAADHSTRPSVTQRSTTLRNPTPKKGEVLLFENLDEELDYLQRENACLEKQREIERLRTRVLSKNTLQHGQSLDALAELPALKRPTPVKLPTKPSTVLLLDYGGHKSKDLEVFICRVENVLEFDMAVYPTKGDRMMFLKQYLISDAAAALGLCSAQHPEGDHTWAAMNVILYSQVAPTKYHTNAAFQKLRSVKQGPDQTVTSFGAYIVTTCEGTDITDYNKRMFFWTG
jgi:hypothetical protein